MSGWNRTCLAAASTLLLIAYATGCGAQQGETVFTAGPGNENVSGTAPYTGTYTLYTALSPNPTLTIKVQQGDPMGFRKADDGNIEAFAGKAPNEQTHKFGKGTTQVYWKYSKG
jgi:hypothetical protein